MTKENDSPKSFEEGMAELENIADELTGEGLSLDDSLKHFERGVHLVRNLNSMLDSYEQKIEFIESDTENNNEATEN